MKDEIKEILDKLKDANWYDELDLTGTMWVELRWEETHLLLDYISNLQEERNDYKDRFNLMAKFRDKALVREWDYKSKIDKATQYYLSTLAQYEKEFKKMPDEAVMMYNLLEGNK